MAGCPDHNLRVSSAALLAQITFVTYRRAQGVFTSVLYKRSLRSPLGSRNPFQVRCVEGVALTSGVWQGVRQMTCECRARRFLPRSSTPGFDSRLRWPPLCKVRLDLRVGGQGTGYRVEGSRFRASAAAFGRRHDARSQTINYTPQAINFRSCTLTLIFQL